MGFGRYFIALVWGLESFCRVYVRFMGVIAFFFSAFYRV